MFHIIIINTAIACGVRDERDACAWWNDSLVEPPNCAEGRFIAYIGLLAVHQSFDANAGSSDGELGRDCMELSFLRRPFFLSPLKDSILARGSDFNVILLCPGCVGKGA